jgi:hypothetical protein
MTVASVALSVLLPAGCAAGSAVHPGRAGSGSNATMPTMVPYRSPAKVSGWASAHPSSSPSATGSPSRCPGARRGFALSLARMTTGAPTPIKAAQDFEAHGVVAGFAVPLNAVWTVLGHDSRGESVTAAGITLHVAQLPDKRWAVDSGERCA